MKNIKKFLDNSKSVLLKDAPTLLNRYLKRFLHKSIKVKILIITLIILSLCCIFFLFMGVKFWCSNIKDMEIRRIKTQGEFKNNFENYNHKKSAKPFEHKTVNTKVNGLEQVINILEIDPNDDRIKIKPVLSHNCLYGFEFLSEMVERHKAYAGVNGGFFYEYGDPSGMVVIDGEIITASTGKFPVFTINEGRAELKELETKLWLKLKNPETDPKADIKTDSKIDTKINVKIELDEINTPGKVGKWILFTRKFGITNRVDKRNISIVIEDNVISSIEEFNGEKEIPKNGMLITFINPIEGEYNESIMKYMKKIFDDIPFKVGDEVEFVYEPDLEPDGQAYECGSWIIKDGKIVINESDPWIGVLTNRDPRTVIGIKNEGEVASITVDGRQPGYSFGFTGQELGEFLLEYGVKYAAMLDGGASTEMIVDNKIVNRPSFKGTERPLAGAIIIEFDN